MPSTIAFGGFGFRYYDRFVPNFGQTQPLIAQLMDRDGGEFVGGDGPERHGVGQITFSFALRARTPREMWGLRNRVVLLQDKGIQRLVYTPAGESVGLHCQAKMTQLVIGHSGRDLSELVSRCNCVFTVTDPRWLRERAAGRLEQTIDDDALAHMFTWRNEGTAVSYPWITLLYASAGQRPGFRLRRLAAGVTVDRIQMPAYNGRHVMLNGGVDYMALDGRVAEARARIRWRHPRLLRLLPGDNVILLEFDSTARGATLYANWPDAWR